MNRIIISLIIGLMLSICACTQNIYNNDNNNSEIIPGTVDVPNLDSVKVVKIENFEDASCGKYSDIYSDVRYIPLEFSTNSIVGNVNKLLITKNNEFLIFDIFAKSIFLFDSNGKYKNRIGDAGHAEKEYIEPLDVVYDEYHDNVIVYDNAKKVLAYYDMNGKYLHRIQLKDYIGSFEVLDKEHLVLYYNYLGISIKDNDINYNYKIIDMEGNVVKTFAPYDRTMDRIRMDTNVFYKNNGELYCQISTTPVVNKITLDSMTPIYYFDFGDHQIPTEWYVQGEESYSKKVSPSLSLNKAVLDKVYQTESTTFFTLTYRLENEGCFGEFAISQDTNFVSYHVFPQLINDLYGKQSASNLLNVENGTIYNVLYPSEIISMKKWPVNTDISKMIAKEEREAMKKIGSTLSKRMQQIFNSQIQLEESDATSIIITDEEKEFVEKMSKSNNPIIQVCTLKK